MGDAGEAWAATGTVRGGHSVRGVRGAGQFLRVAGEPAWGAVRGRAVCRAVRAGQRTAERATEPGSGGGGAGRAAVCEEHAAGVSGAVDPARGGGGDLSGEPGGGEAAGEVSD